MKRSRVIAFGRRFLLAAAAAVLAICFFVFPITPRTPGSDPRSLARLTGYSSEHSLAADELEPYRYVADLPQIERADVGWSVEAETAELPAGSRVLRAREGFSGIGYVAELPEKTQSALVIPVHVPYTQHYAVTLCMASDYPAKGALRINGSMIAPFSLDGGRDFMRITFYGVFLQAGETEIAIDSTRGHLECDYVELENDNSVFDVDFDIRKETCDPNASPAAKRLYGFLRESWGAYTLTGQYASDASNRELTVIYEQTGQLPAVRFGELGTDDDAAQIEAAVDWGNRMKGVVGLMWQWGAPDSGSVYAKDSAFNLRKALEGTDISALASMSADDAASAVTAGQLPEEALRLLRDIDGIAKYLRVLADMDIPVLWRPLHEASGGWYWWGAWGEQSYQRLWKLLFQRLTSFHSINNLIWIWNGQSTAYLVPANTYDIAAVDVYLPKGQQYGSRYEQFLSLVRITGGRKLLALSECSAVPDLKMLLLDKAMWSFFGVWYGEYLLNADGKFSGAYYSSSDLYNLYNSEFALSLKDFHAVYQ